MEAITKEQYLEALETIDNYHKQLFDKVNFINNFGKVDIDNFLDWGFKLIQPSMYTAIVVYQSTTKAKFIEDIDFNKLLDYRMVGEKSIEALKVLIKRYKTTL
jgi:hypothetical protein